MKSLVTPLGIGSMLLLLLSSSLFGYVLMNPGNLTELLGFRHDQLPQPTTSNSQPPASSQSVLSPLEPNLAAQEFKDLNINTLGSLKLHGNALRSPVLPSPLIVPTGQPLGAVGQGGVPGKVAAPGPGGASARVSPGPFGAAVVVPQPRAAYAPPTVSLYSPPQPARRPSSTAPKSAPRSLPVAPRAVPKPIAEIAPVASPSVSPTSAGGSAGRTVVVPYTNDRDLDAAQRVDPNAHMDSSFSDGITRINAGTYGSEAAAKARVEELQRQGVNAEVRETR